MPHGLQASLDGLSVYQDIVLDGRVVRSGVRDCAARWAMIDARLPRSGAMLDIGSNFGWFGLAICRTRPDAVVASLEADERSATVQREVLASHAHRRMALLTARANARLAQRFSAAGQRFAGVLCLSVLHWIRDHRALLSALGEISDTLFVEHPDPREQGAGDPRILGEIGAIGPYLQRLFPDRPVICLGQTASHLQAELPREMWLVGGERTQAAATALDVGALAASGLAWPNRSWWREQLAQGAQTIAADETLTASGLALTPRGLVRSGAEAASQNTQRLIAQIPETGLASPAQWWRRKVRRASGRILQAIGLR